MKIEDFKKMMGTRFSLDGRKVNVVEERPDYVNMEADISIAGIPLKLIDDLHWRKEEVDFCKTLENENVRFLAYYHRTSRATAFDQRNFYFVITKDGEEYPNYFTIYNKEGNVTLGNDKDFFFPRNKKQDTTVEVLEEELRILKALSAYYEPLFATKPLPA